MAGEAELTSGILGGLNEFTDALREGRKESLQRALLERQRKREELQDEATRLGIQKTKQDMALANDPAAKYQKLDQGTRDKTGFIASGLKSLKEMEDEAAKGEGPRWIGSDTPLIGKLYSSTPYENSQRQMLEALGRLESQGQIGKHEADSFRTMQIRPGDTPEAMADKLQKQRDFFLSRAKGLGVGTNMFQAAGFDPEGELGIDPEGQKHDYSGLIAAQKAAKNVPFGAGGLIRGRAQAVEKPQMDASERAAAEAFIKNNPDHPKAAEIRKTLGM